MNQYLLKLMLLLGLSLVGLSQEVLALEVGWRKIKQVGCHTYDSVCYVEVIGSLAGPAACRAQNFRWQINAPNGQENLMLLQAAMHRDKYVNLELSEDCFILMPNFPALKRVTVGK